MKEHEGNTEKFEIGEKWKRIAAWVFFIAAAIFHISMLVNIDDPKLRGMYYDAMNTPNPPPRQDFNALYTQAGNLVAGKSIYPSYDQLTGRTASPVDEKFISNEYKPRAYLPPFRYLPAAALVGLPFTLLSFKNAYIAWLVLHEILILIAICLLYISARDERYGLIFGGMLLFFAPYYLEIFQGQFSWPQAFLMLLVFYHLDCGKGKWAMWGFIGSVLWKLNTLIWVIPLLFAKRWKWLVWLVIAILIGSVPYFIIHPDDLKIFIGINIRPDLTHSFHFGNSGLRMFIDFTMRHADWVSKSGLTAFLAKYLSTIVSLILFGLTVWVSWKRRDDLCGCFLIFGTLYFLIYVDVWVHHWMMILPVVIWEYRRTRSPFVFVIWILLALPMRFDWIGNFETLKPYFSAPERVPNFAMALLYFGQKSIPALALWIWQFKNLVYSRSV